MNEQHVYSWVMRFGRIGVFKYILIRPRLDALHFNQPVFPGDGFHIGFVIEICEHQDKDAQRGNQGCTPAAIPDLLFQRIQRL